MWLSNPRSVFLQASVSSYSQITLNHDCLQPGKKSMSLLQCSSESQILCNVSYHLTHNMPRKWNWTVNDTTFNHDFWIWHYKSQKHYSFLAHLSTKCSWWAIVVSGCPSSVVVCHPSSVNISCLHSIDHICDPILTKLCQNVCFDNI